MHSSLNRTQAVFGFFTTVALFVAGLAALSVLLHPGSDARASVELKNVQVIKGRPHYYSTRKEEYAQIKFDLDADLSPLFNWNTKQLFVYVLASYPSSSSSEETTETTSQSQSIIWDSIISAPESLYSFQSLRERFLSSTKYSSSSSTTSKSKRSNAKKQQQHSKNKKNAALPGVLRLRNQRPKYQISDITGKMAERTNVTLSVGWNVQPWVGALWWGPGSGTVPHTAGSVERSKVFDFPALKGSNRVDAKGTETAGGDGRNERSSVA